MGHGVLIVPKKEKSRVLPFLKRKSWDMAFLDKNCKICTHEVYESEPLTYPPLFIRDIY